MGLFLGGPAGPVRLRDSLFDTGDVLGDLAPNSRRPQKRWPSRGSPQHRHSKAVDQLFFFNFSLRLFLSSFVHQAITTFKTFSLLARCVPRCNCTTLRQSRSRPATWPRISRPPRRSSWQIRLPKRAASTVAGGIGRTPLRIAVHLPAPTARRPGRLRTNAPGQPFLETALAPFAQVLLADGDAVEVACRTSPTSGRALSQSRSWGPASERSDVRSILRGQAGEAGDFTIAGIHSFLRVGWSFQYFSFSAWLHWANHILNYVA